ncbi:MAG: hypothetical protein RMI45_00335 [Ignisphaera sp.]|nr:hypothetical protein [Ignisphaera sp.]
MRYLVVVISKLIEAINLAIEVNRRCQDISTLIEMGRAFLQARYSYADTETVYTILKKLCPCIRETILELSD